MPGVQTTMARVVFFADSIRVFLSSGTVVLTSITSALMPTAARISAALRETCTMLLVATSVMSFPCRLISATPNGIVYSSSGTGPFSWYINLSSKRTTGLSSRIAVLSNPLASYGVAGSTTFKPGMWLNHACRLWLCCAADRRVAPKVVRITIGTLSLPPDI